MKLHIEHMLQVVIKTFFYKFTCIFFILLMIQYIIEIYVLVKYEIFKVLAITILLVKIFIIASRIPQNKMY